jgi:nitrite reductase/ring-hydroxylating ferredoxin subunit
MGELFRRFWLPAMLDFELPSPDCPPVRLRLLGESLVAFRDTSGQLGVLADNCPHRGASLFFGRNEDNGLRCVYHGWKLDIDGNCVDMPNEPADSDFKHKIHHTAYPAKEWGNLIWVYMGPPQRQPELPQLEWCRVPASHRFVYKTHIRANYMQALEGALDSAHASFLHRWFDPDSMPNRRGFDFRRMFSTVAPTLTVQETNYGMLYGARRAMDDGSFHWRVTQWMLPTHTLIPGPNWPKFGGCWIPIDDEHCYQFYNAYAPDRPLTDEERTYYASGLTAVPKMVPGTFHPEASLDNDYFIDRQHQKTRNYTGITGSGLEDMAMVESMGPIYERTREHLGTSDIAIIAARRILLNSARRLSQGIEPPAAANGGLYAVRPLNADVIHADFGTLVATSQEELLARV